MISNTDRISSRLALFPDSTRIHNASLFIAGRDLAALAREFGTPLYIYERATMDASVEAYRSALRTYNSAPSEITYAGKAFLCRAIAEWVEDRKLWLDCTGETEIRTAIRAGVSRERILVHGVNKSPTDLRAGLEHAGTIVVDNLAELGRIASLSEYSPGHGFPDLWLRLLPGSAVQTHHSHTQTGQHGSKFGMERSDLVEAAAFCRSRQLPLRGVHFHQGSNFRDPSPLLDAIDLGLDLAAEIGFADGWHFSPGGGWGVAYHEEELPQPDVEEYIRLITERVRNRCGEKGLSLPRLHIEPGRSLVARAGVALYRVGAVKQQADRTWLLIDGGMSDNPRHALYGSRYSALPLSSLDREMNARVHVGGPLCESGDILIEDLPFPEVEVGEYIAVPVSGAYQLSMSSNYNGARRPAVLWLERDSVRLIQRRESIDDLLGRDLSIKV